MSSSRGRDPSQSRYIIYTDAQLNKLKVEDLLQICKLRGIIHHVSKPRKPDIIASIMLDQTQHLSGAPEEGASSEHAMGYSPMASSPDRASVGFIQTSAARRSPPPTKERSASAPAARGGDDPVDQLNDERERQVEVESAEDWQRDKDWESEYPDTVPSPTSPSDDPRAHISDEVRRWFSQQYLDTFISHFRRNTDVAIKKRPDWLRLISENTGGPFAGHAVNLNPDIKDATIMKYFGYFNYMDYPELGVSDAEMRNLYTKRMRPPRMLILIGGASVGKTSIKPNFVQNATDVDVDDPVMYADAMFEMMPEKDKMWGKGKGINQRYIIYAVAKKLIRNRDDIIIDSTGGSKMAIHLSMNMAIEAGYEIVCVAVWAHLAVASARCDARTATTMRKMSGHGVKFTFAGAVKDKYIEHYALKPRFRNKIDLFFLIDNTSPPTPELVSIAEAETGKHPEVLGDIKIPPTTVLVLKNHHNPDKKHIRTDLIYRTPRPVGDIDFYGCRVHLPPLPHLPHLPRSLGPIPNITPSDIIQCHYPPSSAKKGGSRTRKSNKNNKQTKRKNNRGYYKTKTTRIHRRRRRRTLKF
jgi:hypothetical protein